MHYSASIYENMTAMDWNDLAARPLSSVGGTPGNARTPRDFLPPSGDQNLMGDLPRWMNQSWNTNEPDSSSHQQASETLHFDSLEEHLLHHEQRIMTRILQEATEQAIASADAMIEAQIQSAWEKERERWKKEWFGSVVRRHPNRHGALVESNNAEAGLLIAKNDAHSPIESSTRGSALLALPSSWQPKPADGRLPPTQAPLDLASASAHLQIFQRMENSDKAVNEFLNLLTPQPNFPSSPVDLGYRFAWQVTRDLLRHKRSLALSPVAQATAALEHLCLNFQSMIANRIRIDQTIAPHHFRNNIANQCVVFCKLVLGGDEQSVWPPVFYCLRCGDAVAALEIYQSTPEPDAAVLQLLMSLAGKQGSLPTVWSPPDTTSSGLVVTPSPADRRSVGDLWENCQHRDKPVDLHEQGVYALLSGVALLPASEGSSVPGLSTIEDYLVGAIWKGLSQPNPAQELENLAATIRDFGPDYFGSPGSGGWDFARPLFLTQQYERALLHLTESGGVNGLLQATHLAYVMIASGVVPREFLSDSIVTSLLVSYAQQLVGAANLGAKASLEYVARIPDRRQSRQEVAKLISSTGKIFELVGSISPEGTRVRSESVIDMFFSESEVSMLLAEAAELMLHGNYQQGTSKTHSVGLAAMCYMLAGRYNDVVSLLNQMISPPEKTDENRTFWLQQVKDFRDTYLSKKTEVSVALERDGTQMLETNNILVELNKFFIAQQQGQFQEAWSMIDRLNLLPTAQADLGSKERSYQSLDPLVKQSFPAILVASMEMLHADYRRLKMQVQPNTEGIVRDRLGQIRARASLFVTLAGLVGVAPDEMEKISRLGSLMI